MTSEEMPTTAPGSDRPLIRRIWFIVTVGAATATALLALLIYFSIPRITIAGFDIDQTRDSKFRFTLKLAVQNRLPFNLRLGGYSFDLYLNNERLTGTTVEERIEIPGWEETHVPISIEGYEYELPEFLQMGRRKAPERRTYTWHVAGWIDFLLPIERRINFERSGEVDAFQMPDIMISGIRITRMDLFNPQMVVELEVTNPNGFEVGQEDFIAEVHMNGVPVGRINARQKVVYKPQSQRVVPFDVTVESVRVAGGILRILMSREVYVRLRGSLVVHAGDMGVFPFEFDKEGPAPVFGLPFGQR